MWTLQSSRVHVAIGYDNISICHGQGVCVVVNDAYTLSAHDMDTLDADTGVCV